jgi:hypothetical protein
VFSDEPEAVGLSSELSTIRVTHQRPPVGCVSLIVVNIFDPHFPDLRLLAPGIAVLTAMITPAVLILASGTLLASTSSRLGRVVDRVRVLSESFEQFEGAQTATAAEHRAHIFNQLDKLTSRARWLQWSMTTLYLAVASFVATSVAIGLLAFIAIGPYSVHVPVILALGGMAFLFAGSILLILEARLAIYAVSQEMDFLWKRGQALAPADRGERQSSLAMPSEEKR